MYQASRTNQRGRFVNNLDNEMGIQRVPSSGTFSLLCIIFDDTLREGDIVQWHLQCVDKITLVTRWDTVYKGFYLTPIWTVTLRGNIWSFNTLPVLGLFKTHWGREKMAAIFQTTFSYAFSWMKILKFRLRFHWSLFPRVQLTIFQHWFR